MAGRLNNTLLPLCTRVCCALWRQSIFVPQMKEVFHKTTKHVADIGRNKEWVWRTDILVNVLLWQCVQA